MEQLLEKLINTFKVELQSDIKEVRKMQDDHEIRLRGLEKDNTSNKKDIENMKETLSDIKKNTTYILRLIIGFIIVAVLGYLIKTPPA